MRVPVRKYRSVEDMPGPPPARSALDGLASACALSRLTGALGTTRSAPRGLRRFRSIEELDAHREEWELGPRRDGGDDASGGGSEQRR
jgi:hypothetical protein